jgi:enoyl-CoA hydratase
MELMLTGRIIDGEESARIGLVNRVVPHDQLMEKAMEVAAEIAFNPIEQSRGVKEVTWKNLDEDELSEVQRLEGVWLRKARTSKAFGEAVNAFLDKRQPDFHNLQ